MKTYRAVAERSGEWWAISVPELPGVFTQAKTLEKAETMAEAIALMLDIDTDEVKAEVEAKVPTVEGALADIKAAQRRRAEAEDRVTAQLESTVRQLTAVMSVRDAGRLLGISYQRVSQLSRTRVGTRSKALSEKTSRRTHA